MPNGGTGNGGGYGGDNGGGMFGRRPPAEVHEERKAGEALDYRLVIKQARAVSLALAFAFLSAILAVIALGPALFWGVAGVVSLTSMIWWMRQEVRLERAAMRGEEIEQGINFLSIASSVAIALLTAFVAWCFWRVAGYMVPEIHMPEWWDGSFWQRALVSVTRLGSLLSLIFSIWYFIHLEIPFGQEAIQRSPMQEQFIWQAIGKILETWGVAAVRRPRPRNPVIVHSNRDNGNDGHDLDTIRTALDERLRLENGGTVVDVLTPEQQEGRELMEFLVLGQYLKGKDGTLMLYSRRDWNGVQLPSGRAMGVSRARKMAGELSKAGILAERETDTGRGLDLAPNLTLANALNHISVEWGTPLPHPQEVQEWARGGDGYQPNPAPPTQPTQQGGGAEDYPLATGDEGQG